MFQYEALHVGCNRIPTAATWSSNLGLIYGAERLIAVADPVSIFCCKTKCYLLMG